EGADLRIERRTTLPASPSIGPLRADELAVPPQERLRPDHEQAPPVPRDGSARGGEHDAVEPSQANRPALPTEHPDLVSEHGVLELQGVDRGAATHPGEDPLKEELEDQEHRRMLERAINADLRFSRPTGKPWASSWPSWPMRASWSSLPRRPSGTVNHVGRPGSPVLIAATPTRHLDCL